MRDFAHPDIGGIIQGSLGDAWPIMRSRLRVYIVLAIIAGIAGIIDPFVPLPNDSAIPWRLELVLQPPNILGAIAAFFSVPAVIRTVRPDFRMTFGRVLG